MSKMSVAELEELIYKIDLMLSEDIMSEGIGNLFSTKESE
jgi:hypothetical protein